MAWDRRGDLERLAATGRDRGLVSAGTVDCGSPRDFADSVFGHNWVANWPAARVEVDDFRRSGAGDNFFFSSHWHSGGALCRCMVGCLRFVRAQWFAQTLATS